MQADRDLRGTDITGVPPQASSHESDKQFAQYILFLRNTSKIRNSRERSLRPFSGGPSENDNSVGKKKLKVSMLSN